MTSLTSITTAPAGLDAPTEASRRERRALTESLLIRLATCRLASERRELQQQVVVLNLSLADRTATRYAGRGVEWDDLVQVARVGLLKAVIGYRAGERAGFAAYAKPTIAGEIKRHFRDHGWMIRPPRRLQELNAELRLVEPDLQQRLHRRPSAAELASELGVQARELSDAQTAARGYDLKSLDVPRHPGSTLLLGDELPDDSDPYTEVERTEWLRPAIARLTEHERSIIRMRFVDGLTQEQIGNRLAVSQMQVSRLLGAILERLRDDIGFDDVAATA